MDGDLAGAVVVQSSTGAQGLDELVWSDARSQATAIREGSVTALDLTNAFLDRIATFNETLRAYVTVDVAGARAAAVRCDEMLRTGDPKRLPPFHGVTISVKDAVDVEGMPTTHSCKVLADNVAIRDDLVVRRFRDAGFIVLGKTNVPEFCTSMTSSELNGICRNPWDLERTPGGSSGGAASALAAALCAVSHGTDGAGSVRVPAAFCGLVGLKPTRGAGFDAEESNPYYGTSVDGVLTRSVADAVAMQAVLTGTAVDMTEAVRDPGTLRIAVSTVAPFGDVDSECAAAALEVGERLAELGHDVEAATPNWNAILVAATGPMSAPGLAAMIREDQIDQLEPRNRPLLRLLASLTVVEHAAWVSLVRRASAEFLEFWNDIDVLVTPTAGMTAPSVAWAPWDQTPKAHLESFRSFANFCQPFNLSGQPALSLPRARSRSGLPIGVQLAGRRNDELTLFRLAAQLEAATDPLSVAPPTAMRQRF
ncbi:MAG: amidase [Actinobacteria bacterium]|nr:amidase [Actinomycetota bacterium]